MADTDTRLADLVFDDHDPQDRTLPLVDRKSFLATYGDKARERYYEFQAFQRTSGFYTNVARDLAIPTSRAKGWDKGSKPKMVPAVEHLQRLGWFDDEWTEATEGLAKLVVGIHASGTLKSSFVPYWRPGESRALYRSALNSAGVEVEQVGSKLKPAVKAGPIGRALWVGGAPRGDDDNRRGLPLWLTDAPQDVVQDCARMLVLARSTQNRPETDMRMIGAELNREPSWFRDVAALLELATGHSTPPWEGGGMTIPADAVRALGLA